MLGTLECGGKERNRESELEEVEDLPAPSPSQPPTKRPTGRGSTHFQTDASSSSVWFRLHGGGEKFQGPAGRPSNADTDQLTQK